MKRLIRILVLSFFVFSNPANSNENLINSLKEGEKLIFIRHAYAPGNGDPENFNLKDCSSQRNLDQEGVIQSKKIGFFFTKDTAKYAFNTFETFDALNSFYDIRFAKNKSKQIKDLKKYIYSWGSKKNLVLVTHFVVINEVLNTSSSSGEIIVSDRNFNVIGSIKTATK